MSRDPISELIIGIKNAGQAKNSLVKFPYSNLKLAIAEVLQKEGFIKSVAKIGKAPKRILEIEIAYSEKNNPKIKDVKRVSKLSKRIYSKSQEIKPVKRGHGLAILSTSQGIVTDKQAKKLKIGGEVLFNIW